MGVEQMGKNIPLMLFLLMHRTHIHTRKWNVGTDTRDKQQRQREENLLAKFRNLQRICKSRKHLWRILVRILKESRIYASSFSSVAASSILPPAASILLLAVTETLQTLTV